MTVGPVADYAVVIVSTHALSDAGWVGHTNSTAGADEIGRQLGPLRVGRRPRGMDGVDSVVPRDNIGYWSDGTSNQLVIGEKHIPNGTANVCRAPWWQQGECSALAISGRAVAGASRRLHNDSRLANGPNDYVLPSGADQNSDNPDYAVYAAYGFGSNHPGICMFLIGDGAVRSISNSTSMRNVLVPLGNVADGVSVSLP